MLAVFGQGLIASPTAQPSAITVNTATPVTFRALITSAGAPVLPTSVTLLQVDQDGNNATVIGTLNDNGTNGDRLANDGIFGGSVVVTSPTSGYLYFRVSAAFAGSLRRTLSPTIPIVVMPANMPTQFRPTDLSKTVVITDGLMAVCNELLVAFQPNVSPTTVLALINANGWQVSGVIAALGVYQIDIPTCDAQSLTAARASLSGNALVLSVDFDSPAQLAQINSSPRDPFYIQKSALPGASAPPQWYLSQIDMPTAWSVAEGFGLKGGAAIGVVDTGVNMGHEDLVGHAVPGFNWCASLYCTQVSPDPSDDYGHGTEVAGLAAAISDNNVGVASPAFNSLIFVEKVASHNKILNIVSESPATVAQGISDAVYLGAKVINVSHAVNKTTVLKRAIEYAYRSHVIIVAAAGNFGSDSPDNPVQVYPAGYATTNANVIAVGATDQYDQLSVWKKKDGHFCEPQKPSTNYGPWVTLFAPGSEMLVLNYQQTSGTSAYWYETDSPSDPVCSAGTSFSAPLVTGTISLMIEVNPSISPEAIRALLVCSGDRIAGGGTRINAGRAVLYASKKYTTCPTAPPVSSIIDLGTLGGTSAVSNAINDAGQVVGGSSTGQYGGGGAICGNGQCPIAHAFLWTTGLMMRDLGLPEGANAVDSEASGINDSGDVVGAYSYPGYYSAPFRYSGGVMMDLGIGFGGASAINANGQIAGGFSSAAFGPSHAYLYSPSTMVLKDLGTLGGQGSSASAINDTGLVVGESNPPGNAASHAFLYDGTLPIKDLGTLGGANSSARGINAKGQVVGWAYTPNAQHAFLYSGSFPLHDLGTLGGLNSQADSINRIGQVVGWADTTSGEQRAFLWTGTEMLDFNGLFTLGQGALLSEATAINDVGQVAANGNNGHAYLLSLPSPIPPVIVLSGDGTVTLGQSVPFPVSLSAPAPTGGVVITLTNSDSSKATIDPSTVTIAAGATTPAVVPQVAGVGLGAVVITAAASGYVSVFQRVQVTAIVYTQTSYDATKPNVCMVNPISGVVVGVCDAFSPGNEPTGNPPGKLASITVKLQVQSDSEFAAWNCYWGGLCGPPGDFGYVTVYSPQINQACGSTNQPLLANFPRDTWQDFTFTFDSNCLIDFSKGNQITSIQRAGGPWWAWGIAFGANGQLYVTIRSR